MITRHELNEISSPAHAADEISDAELAGVCGGSRHAAPVAAPPVAGHAHHRGFEPEPIVFDPVIRTGF
jgi:hypothetical protein